MGSLELAHPRAWPRQGLRLGHQLPPALPMGNVAFRKTRRPSRSYWSAHWLPALLYAGFRHPGPVVCLEMDGPQDEFFRPAVLQPAERCLCLQYRVLGTSGRHHDHACFYGPLLCPPAKNGVEQHLLLAGPEYEAASRDL